VQRILEKRSKWVIPKGGGGAAGVGSFCEPVSGFRNPMSEATLVVSRPDDVLTLFGAKDQHLRMVRRLFGVQVTHRDGQIKVAGEDEGVRKATRVFERLKQLADRQGSVGEEDLRAVLGEVGASWPEGERTEPANDVDIRQAGRRVKPRSNGQSTYVATMRQYDLTICTGPAGTGKTYLAVAMAVEALKSRQVRKIVLVRPAVEAGENLGFLPGDLRAKLNPYLRPLLDALNEMVDFDQVRSLMEQDVIEVIPLAYMRGRTLNDAFIILDEAQNATVAQMKMFLTRMGERSKMVVTGDPSQVDLPRGTHSGLRDALERLRGIERIGVIELQRGDIVRHPLVQQIVDAYEEHSS
jgi:phosphate starvation-inducible PhoH-like protein